MKIKTILKKFVIPYSKTSRLDIELILSSILNKTRVFLYSNEKYKLTTHQKCRFKLLYRRRLSGEPIPYILKEKEFWSLSFFVNKNVLIPRPETELLVENALRLINKKAVIADLGTGSGAIAISLGKERPDWKIIATDIDKKALSIAKFNAKKIGIDNIKFYQGSWCKALPKIKLDAIISNPPYIANNSLFLKKNESISFEPNIALNGGRNGLRLIEKIIFNSKKYLKINGYLMLEHGYDQQKEIHILFNKHGYKHITSYNDLSRIPRITIASFI